MSNELNNNDLIDALLALENELDRVESGCQPVALIAVSSEGVGFVWIPGFGESGFREFSPVMRHGTPFR